MSVPLIETRGLVKHFGGVQAIRGVDFALAKGELRCLIGPNGAGKSTFFKLLTGQIRPSSGTVLFRGTDITALQAHEIARLGIGIKTQVPSVFDGLSVRDNLWIAAARQQGPALDGPGYAALAQESKNVKPFTYSAVMPGLFDSIVALKAPQPETPHLGRPNAEVSPRSPAGTER